MLAGRNKSFTFCIWALQRLKQDLILDLSFWCLDSLTHRKQPDFFVLSFQILFSCLCSDVLRLKDVFVFPVFGNICCSEPYKGTVKICITVWGDVRRATIRLTCVNRHALVCVVYPVNIVTLHLLQYQWSVINKCSSWCSFNKWLCF